MSSFFPRTQTVFSNEQSISERKLKKKNIKARKTNFVKRVESLECEKKNQMKKVFRKNAFSIGDNNGAHVVHASATLRLRERGTDAAVVEN